MQIKTIFIILFITITDRVYSQNDSTINLDDRNSLKFDLFSPLQGCVGFSYETKKTNFHSFDIETGFIGLILSESFINEKFLGGYCNAGIRFYFSNNNNILQYPDLKFNGIYIKPEAVFNYYTYHDNAAKGVDGKSLAVALIMCVGNQWNLLNNIVLDGWFGFGYDKNWVSEIYSGKTGREINYHTNNYNYFHILQGPLICDFGISVGILLK